MTAANNWIGEEAKHKRNDNFVEFARGNVFYKVGNSGYSADVVVGIRSDGTAVLHDLVNIWKTKITEAPYTSQSTKYSADRTGTSVITDNVSQSGGDVKYSFSGNGYNGYSMSNNAVYAYENGEKPISKWTKSDILSEIANIDEEKAALVKDVPLSTLKQNLLYNSSYHHTSSHYNKTQFYAVDADVVDSLTPETVAEWKNQKLQAKASENTYRGDIDYVEWSGSRKHPKAENKTLTDVNITEKGSFYIVTDDNGNVLLRKKIGSNGTYVTKQDAGVSVQEDIAPVAQKQTTSVVENDAYWKTWDTYKNSSSEAQALVDKMFAKGYEKSGRGYYYEVGRKPNSEQYKEGNFFKEGEQRLYSQWDPETDTYFFEAETYKDGKWVKESIKETDNQGRPVSKEQQKYFAESKVRDADGKLKTMYRGDSQEITTFDRNKSRNSNLYGRGFYVERCTISALSFNQ